MKTFSTLIVLVALSLPAAHGQSLDYLPLNSFYKDYKNLGSSRSAAAHLPVAIDPEALTAPPGSEMMREEHQRFPPMVIYLKKPSKTWRTQLEQALMVRDFDLALAIRVGFVEYPKASKGLFEKKVILGTGYERVIQFLSADDEPVEVLQLTGVLLNRKGEVVRAGAEGIIHEDTPLWAQAFDIQKGIDDETIASLIVDFSRYDLPGQPLAWQTALETLVRQLMIPVATSPG